MIESLINIGSVIRNDSNLRIKYHPLIRNINRANEKTKPNNIYTYYQINIDTVNNSIEYSEDGNCIAYNDDVYILKYQNSSADTTYPYIIGNYEYSGGKDIKLNSILKYRFNCEKLGITNPFILKVNDVLDSNIDGLTKFFNGITSELNNIIIIVKIDDKEFTEYSEIFDEIDRLFITGLCDIDSNGYYMLKNSLYSFFGVSYGNNLGQVPGFKLSGGYKSLPLDYSKINNLIYGEKFHSGRLKNLVGDYYFNFLPCGDSIKHIILKSDKSNNIVSASRVISENSEVESEEDSEEISMFNTGFDIREDIPKEKISYDIIFKLKGGNVNNDIMILPNYNLTYLEELNNKFNKIRGLLYDDRMKFFPSPKSAFIKLFKKDKRDDSKDVNKMIFNFLIEFYKGDYNGSELIDKYFIDKFSSRIRNCEGKIQNEYSDLILNYKIVRYMENGGIEKLNKELNNNSYLLGKCLGTICQTWQDDRKNLEHFVTNFNGQISRHIKNMGDVNNYFNQIIQRLSRNKCRIYSDDITLFTDLSSKIDVLDITLFIRGYFESQYSYKNKK
jgi:hypothetical protein